MDRQCPSWKAAHVGTHSAASTPINFAHTREMLHSLPTYILKSDPAAPSPAPSKHVWIDQTITVDGGGRVGGGGGTARERARERGREQRQRVTVTESAAERVSQRARGLRVGRKGNEAASRSK